MTAWTTKTRLASMEMRIIATVEPRDVERMAKLNPCPYLAKANRKTEAMRTRWTLVALGSYNGTIKTVLLSEKAAISG